MRTACRMPLPFALGKHCDWRFVIVSPFIHALRLTHCFVSLLFTCTQALEQYLAGGFNEGAVAKQVTNGKGAMPAFGGRLSDEAIADVATYVISASRAANWD